jgi:hypothetical protein
MSKTDYLENEVLKLSTGQTLAISPPITPWVALFTAAPTDAGGGTEVSGGGYGRVNASSKFSAPSGGSCSNNAVIDFGTASAAWGTVVAYAIMTASTGGTMLRWELLSTQRVVNNTDPVSFGIGNLTLSES